MLDVFVGRQPIFDRELDVIGYELLFRSHDTDKAEFVDGDRATSDVILNTFMEIGLDRLAGDGLAFINLTQDFILDKHPIPLLSDRVVIEVLEDVKVDKELVKALQMLSSRGYKIALDDVVRPEDVGPLLEVADIVKLDLAAVEQGHLGEYVDIFRRHDLKLLAEKVETPDVFDLCKRHGFDYFQGYFLCRPNVVSGHRMPSARLAILRLLAKLSAPDMEFEELEEILRQDVSLSYKLLRVINSAFYAIPTKIESIRQALTLLGIRQIRCWATLLLLSKIDDRPLELMVTAVVRAKMCELLAGALKERRPGIYFMAGLFSVLDALMEVPLQEALGLVPLSEEIVSALLRYEGRLGSVLRCVLAYERGDWGAVRYPGIEPEVICDAYLESLDWANELRSLLGQKEAAITG
jgi:EAL and modified HD-GYP domain-containing signal transduction protein